MKRTIVGIVAGLLLFAATGCDTNTAGNKPTTTHATTNAKQKGGGGKTTTKSKSAKPKPSGPVETSGQANARAKAADYLSYTSFSRTGLIKQLQYEGFSVKDATYGADSQNADWMKEAVLKAKDYLGYTSFSHSGLVAQLKYDGFTPEQAEHGATGAGL